MLPVKRAIMILLSLMVGLVLVVSWLMASANLEFAEKAMAQLRQRQIADTFYANLDRINAHHRLMAQSTAGLARAGGKDDNTARRPRDGTRHGNGSRKHGGRRDVRPSGEEAKADVGKKDGEGASLSTLQKCAQDARF